MKSKTSIKRVIGVTSAMVSVIAVAEASDQWPQLAASDSQLLTGLQMFAGEESHLALQSAGYSFNKHHIGMWTQREGISERNTKELTRSLKAALGIPDATPSRLMAISERNG